MHMTRTVSMSWVLLKGLQLLCFACTALPTAFVHSQEECQLQRSFDSSYLQASYREEAVLDAGCRVNNGGHFQQIHVLNYKSTHAGSSPANVLVNIDSQSETIQTATLVLVLNANVSVEWEVELQSPADLDVPLIKFEISRTSTLEFASQSKIYEVDNTISPPVGDQELLTWVRSQYRDGIITSYSAFHDVDEVTMVINADPSAPSVCDLTSHKSPSKGYTLEDQVIWGCNPGNYDVINRRQIHVIELFSPTKYVEDNSLEKVDVHIQKGANLEEGPRDTLLILVGQSSTLWQVESSRINGKLTIISNNQVHSSGSQFTLVEMKIYNNIAATKKGLLQWVEEEYGPVSSFSNVRVANMFQVYLAGPTPVILTSPSLLESTTPRTATGRLGNTELADSIEVNCQNASIQVVIPMEVVLKYDLQEEAVTWLNKSCSGIVRDEGLVLRSDGQSCGSTYSEGSEGAVVETNQVTFYSSPVSEGSGMTTLDDDEDSVQILAQRKVNCSFDIINFMEQTPESVPEPLPKDTALYLDLYTDIKFAKKRTVQPYRLEIGDPIYFEMGVTRDPRLNIVIGECWIGIPQARLFEDRLTSITEDGCPVEPSFQYLPVEFQPFQTKMPPGTVKRFTFNVPNLDKYAMTFYVFCNLSLCTNAAPLHEYPQIVECSSVPKENAPCSEWKQLKLWPMKNIQHGPFRVNSREIEHNNNLTGASSTSCQNPAGGAIQVTSLIFGVVIFISFCIGVLLVSSMWLITKYTRVPSPSSPANSPTGNGHIPNGHLPNGEARFEMQPFIQDGVNPNNIPHEGLYDGFGDPQV